MPKPVPLYYLPDLQVKKTLLKNSIVHFRYKNCPITDNTKAARGQQILTA
jgi:hypothetical protein